MSENEAMEIFLNSPVTQDMIHQLVNVTLQILPCESSKTIVQQLPSPPNSPPVYKTKPLPSLMTFITKLVRYTNVYTGTLMSTIVYMNRLKCRLPKDAQGMACTRHRIFLACLIIASKYFNDCSPKNKHWSKYTDGLFRKEDVNLMERQLLMLMDWDVRIETFELTTVWKRFLDPIRSDMKKQSRIRNGLAKGTMIGSTQTIVVPKQRSNYTTISASSSISSISSLVSAERPRVSSVSSASSSNYSSFSDNDDATHSRESSVSSVSSDSPYSIKLKGDLYHPQNITPIGHSVGCVPQNDFSGYQVTNYLDNCAIREQQQLNNLMRQYCSN
ncbi:DEKNAAC103528 [Brettanomyces naardenensis]|uniref:DEKNAAC103528 n=1 Tax=Brettanomyces naardenensis TaxID=13370 RepID=A0A448YN80_BRENA|nr:DEKNAAC103528 [Brettanomyces naardenensis]